jgi:hypothetical protein
MAGSATDDWLTFADTHFIPHESIERCEGWPKGKPLFCRTVELINFFVRRVGPSQNSETLRLGHNEVSVIVVIFLSVCARCRSNLPLLCSTSQLIGFAL